MRKILFFAICFLGGLSGFTQPFLIPDKLDPLSTNILSTQFTDPLPHFAAGLRVDVKAGGNLLIKSTTATQITLPTGTVLSNGTIGDQATPDAGKGLYAVYSISKDGGASFGPAMWPAQTIETSRNNQLVVQYRNDLLGLTYQDFNVIADQTLMMNGFPKTGNPLTDPYTGPIPMVTHLHGGEIPSNSDGGPTAWFMPGYSLTGPGFQHEASSVCTYPNKQEGTTLFYHPHDQGLTRINLYLGMAGLYFLRDPATDALHLPGWSQDDKVVEHTPAGKTATFNGSSTYLPEIELAIQDRQFNVNGGLYWPVDGATNPSINPFWTPEFFGDVMTVNGKAWPYFSVAPRKYAFRSVNGCNARWLNLWLQDAATGDPGPKITAISTEGGLLETPVDFDKDHRLLISPAERPILIIDFTGQEGKTFTLMNDANAPYPNGDPVIPGLTDRIMQFVVNGEMVSATNPAATPADKSVVPPNLRPTNPLIKLTDFNGNLNVTPDLKRQLILNEVTGEGGPVSVLVNNSRVDNATQPVGAPPQFGGPTEIPREGTTEVWQIINTTVDAHPMHPHLVQWQLVSRQEFDVTGYMAAYTAAWNGAAPWPAVPEMTYPGGAGSPKPYDQLNTDNAVGGNPAVSSFLTPGTLTMARPEEKGWKDAITAIPGTVETYIVRFTPTDLPLNATPQQKIYPFDPSTGPGYVWHCHIVDHEDMEMMRPLMVKYAAVRNIPIVTGTESTSRDANFNQLTYTTKLNEFTASATAPKGGVLTLSYVVSGATQLTGNAVVGNPVNGTTTVNASLPAGTILNIGTNNIVWTAVNNENMTGTFTTVVNVNKRQTIIDYKGAKLVRVNEVAILIATLKDKATKLPLAGKNLKFTIGNQSITDKTNYLGLAISVLKVTQNPIFDYTLETKFEGDAGYLPASTSIPFNILPPPCTMVIPNGFSPNGDGINDLFKITCLDQYPNAKLSVYNVLMRLVYEKAHYGNLDFWGSEDQAWWNGLSNIRTNVILPSGTYIYILDLDSSKPSLVKTGTVFLSK